MLAKQQRLILSPYTELYTILIPKDNLLRRMDELVDFSFVYEELNESYCHNNGRTAVDPVRMFKYLLLKSIFDLSDVDLVERSKTDLSFKFFLHMAPEEEVIDSSLPICLTDPDSRGMENNGKSEVCYNVQTVVDSKNCLIIDTEVVNDINDLNQLSNMSTNAKKTLNKRKITVIADTGYYNAQEIKNCISKKIKVYIKKPIANNKTGDAAYRKERFNYVAEDDKYICPEGMELPFAEYTTKNTVKYKRYKGTQCQNCSKKSLCTQAKEGRNIQRLLDEDIIEKNITDTKNNINIYKKRRCIVEHPFGTIKRNLNYTYFLRQGLASVNTEAASIFVAYNLKRVVNILSVQGAIQKLQLHCS